MPAESGFRAVKQSADIFPMRPDHKRRDEKRQHEHRPIPRTEDQCCDREADCTRYRSERDIPRCEPQQRKQSPADRRNAPVQQQQERAAAKNALAALKGIERRENVSNYAEQGGKYSPSSRSPRYASNTAEPSFTATNALSISTSMTQIANFSPYTR